MDVNWHALKIESVKGSLASKKKRKRKRKRKRKSVKGSACQRQPPKKNKKTACGGKRSHKKYQRQFRRESQPQKRASKAVWASKATTKKRGRGPKVQK